MKNFYLEQEDLLKSLEFGLILKKSIDTLTHRSIEEVFNEKGQYVILDATVYPLDFDQSDKEEEKEESNDISLDYHEIKQTIADALLDYDKSMITGLALMKGIINIHDKDAWNRNINLFLDGISHHVLANLQKKFSDKIQITESGEKLNF